MKENAGQSIVTSNKPGRKLLESNTHFGANQKSNSRLVTSIISNTQASQNQVGRHAQLSNSIEIPHLQPRHDTEAGDIQGMASLVNQHVTLTAGGPRTHNQSNFTALKQDIGSFRQQQNNTYQSGVNSQVSIDQQPLKQEDQLQSLQRATRQKNHQSSGRVGSSSN